MEQSTIQVLQNILSGILTGSQQHFIHATINKSKGFTKIADIMMEEYNEEVRDAGKIMNRILELGGVPVLEAAKLEIYADVESQLKAESKEQVKGLAALQQLYYAIENDVPTKNLLMDYITSETNHSSWLQQQVNLIDAVGIQNYLAAQI